MSVKTLQRFERRFGKIHGELVTQIVLDPFNGSGTTAEVALKHGRKYIGLELNPEYVELSLERLAEIQPFLFLAKEQT